MIKLKIKDLKEEQPKRPRPNWDAINSSPPASTDVPTVPYRRPRPKWDAIGTNKSSIIRPDDALTQNEKYLISAATGMADETFKSAGKAASPAIKTASKIAGPAIAAGVAIYDGITGKTDGTWQGELKKWIKTGSGLIGSLLGSSVGSFLGIPAGPAGTFAGGLSGGLIGGEVAEKASDKIMTLIQDVDNLSDTQFSKKYPLLSKKLVVAKNQYDSMNPINAKAASMNENKNILNNDVFEYSVNTIINSLEADNYNQDLSKYNPVEVKMGLEIEQEHTSDPKELSKIVADHLEEDPEYYSKMKKSGIHENINIFVNNMKNDIEEGRSKRRWLHSLHREIKSYIVGLIKNDIQKLIQDRILYYSKNLFQSKFRQYPIMKNFGDVYIIVREDKQFSSGGGEYYYGNSTIQSGNDTYNVNRGDFVFYIDSPSNIENFEQIKDIFLKYTRQLTETISHEVMHFIDDFKGDEGLQPSPERDLFYQMPKHYIQKYNYYMDDAEVSAYVEGAMTRARMLKVPFIKSLYSSVIKGRIEPTFRRSINLNKIKNIIFYKYLRFAMRKYNSVMDDPIANKYYTKLENFILSNNLQNYVTDKEMEDKEERMKAKELRRQEWEKEHGESEEYLEEGKTKLSKYWNKRAKSRAKRAGRHYPNNKDKEWALNQEEKSKDLSGTLKKAFEAEIKETEDISKKLAEIISTNKKKSKDPFVSGITGRAKGFKQKHKGKLKIPPGADFGPLEEEI